MKRSQRGLKFEGINQPTNPTGHNSDRQFILKAEDSQHTH